MIVSSARFYLKKKKKQITARDRRECAQLYIAFSLCHEHHEPHNLYPPHPHDTQDVQIEICAILNDTTGTLMSCAWKNHNCRIGLIVGM